MHLGFVKAHKVNHVLLFLREESGRLEGSFKSRWGSDDDTVRDMILKTGLSYKSEVKTETGKYLFFSLHHAAGF